MTEHSLILVKEIDIQVQKAHKILNEMNPKRPTPIHNIIEMIKVKDKERILKVARGKQFITYKGDPIRLSPGFSTKTLQARRDWQYSR